jgi:hypothetical protein
MPVHSGENKKGLYFQWGHHGKKYYYNPYSKISMKNAQAKASKQGMAAFANGYKGK